MTRSDRDKLHDELVNRFVDRLAVLIAKWHQSKTVQRINQQPSEQETAVDSELSAHTSNPSTR